MIEVELPDGTILEFPEGTSQDVMRLAAQKYMAGPTVAAQDAALDPQRRAYMEARARGEIPPPVPVSDAERARSNAITSVAEDDMRASGYGALPEVGQAAAFLLGGAQGASLGFSDELGAGITAPFSDRTYDELLQYNRTLDDAASQQNPWTFAGGQVTGALATALATRGALKGAGAAPATPGALAAQGLGLGAIEGAVSGFGAGEGLQDRLRGAAFYGALGGAIGGAAPSVVAGFRKGTDALIGAPIAAVRSGPSQVRASAAIAETMRRAGMSPDEISASLRSAADEGQPEFLLADALGSAGQRRLSDIARSTPDARPAVVDALVGRQSNQTARISQILKDALGVTDTAAARSAALSASRKEAADIAYAAAREGAGPVNLNGTIETIDALLRRDPILGETALSQGPLGARLSALRARMATDGEQLIDFDAVQNLKSDLGDQIARGRGGREVAQVYAALDSALEASSPGYRAANDGYRAASGAIDAIPLGSQASRASVRADDATAQYLRLTPEQQQPFRTGFVDPLLARIENATDKARILASDGMAAKLAPMAADPALLQRQIGRESTMVGTDTAALRGSMTADNLAGAADVANSGPLLSLLTGDFRGAVTGAGRAAGNALTGRNTATRAEIARMLLSRDIQGALAPAIRAEMRSGAQNRVVEALLRSLARPTQ
jgi:hypothetical protein